ncbi:MAG TPA: hypothetical protein VHC63_05230 [Acidimicrobiales bacterium]|nr:hypothetical protein [Acidimicrobiales bacterium]
MLLVAAAGVWFRTVVVPRRPKNSRHGWPRRIPEGDPRPTTAGNGLRLVVNPSAGPAFMPAPTDALREALPAADVHELDKADDLAQLLSDRCSRTRFAAAVMVSGRLARCHVYCEWTAMTLDDGPAKFTVAKKPRALRVAVPPLRD